MVGLRWTAALLPCLAAWGAAAGAEPVSPRVCRSPDCLVVGNLHVILNGKLLRRVALEGRSSYRGAVTAPATPGWCLVQVFAARDPLPLAMCSPVFIEAPRKGTP